MPADMGDVYLGPRREVGRCEVSHRNDVLLNPCGKRCTSNSPNLPGGVLGRTLTEPTLRPPEGWMYERGRRQEQDARREQMFQRASSMLNPSVNADKAVLFASPGKSSASPGLKSERFLPHGGKAQGAKIPDDRLAGSIKEYDGCRHGWYHPKANDWQRMLRFDGGNRSWAWDIRKSRDHIGYGDGTIGYGDVQESAISQECPEWWVGVRMVDGPYGVPRFPACEVNDDGKLQMNNRVFSKGPNLSIIETEIAGPSGFLSNSAEGSRSGGDSRRSSEGSKASSVLSTPHFDDYKNNPAVKFNPLKPANFDRRCLHGHIFCERHPCKDHLANDTKSQLVAGSCTVARPHMPKSNWVGIDPRLSQ